MDKVARKDHKDPGPIARFLLITGLLATALAFTTQAWAQQYTSASRAALIFALEPVVAWTTSWMMTGEAMPNRGKAGAGLILAGILLVELKRTTTEGHHKEGAVSWYNPRQSRHLEE